MVKKSSCRMGFCLRRSPRQHDKGYDMVRFLIDGCACSSVDRASASGAEGHRFKSCQAHHNSLLKCLLDQPSNNLSERSKWPANKTADVVSTGGVTLWGTLRMLTRRERSWAPFSAFRYLSTRWAVSSVGRAADS
jgi:hypothetical protein